MKIQVACFFGGQSVEHEISVISALQAMKNLRAEAYEIHPVYITKEGEFYTGEALRDVESYRDIPALCKRCRRVALTREDGRVYLILTEPKMFEKNRIAELDVALPVVHGTNTEDGTLAGYLRLIGLPAVGCDVLSAALGMDKYAMKVMLRDADIPVLPCRRFTRRQWADRDASVGIIEESFPFPVIVKPVNLGSSVGISVAHHRDELIAAMDQAFTYAPCVLVEPAITELREINCSVLGDADSAEASECEEPLGGGVILSYTDKYMDGGAKDSDDAGMASLKRRIPADISQEIREEIRALAVRAFLQLGCSGVVRIDFLMDRATGKVWLNEINTIPGSLSFYLWEPLGLSYSELLDRLISLALKRARQEEEITYSFDQNIFALGGGFGGIKGSKGCKR